MMLEIEGLTATINGQQILRGWTWRCPPARSTR